MADITPSLPALATITAAAIAGVVAFIISVLTKEHRISEFRQSWIDSLRNDISELLSLFNLLAAAFDREAKLYGDKNKALDEHWTKHHADLVNVQTLTNRVVLRLNKKEHSVLIGKLAELEDSLGKGQAVAVPIIDGIMAEVSSLLKLEWERVKNGETVFQALKRFSFWFTCLGLIAVILSLFYYIYTLLVQIFN
ncbi:hypothetical protein HX862_13825 [Pseudomonas sp. D5002]|jgi:hypothetical protein|uniref:hypothetical protein n=1 Tax=Pseudomonas sp. D5002 TaxID=2738818 RepID=UPI0015A140EC|nr:hypothetical protein [Pseudomonas sp. D5002]NWB08986.1 hypothetical protein [Pseudomonas sp. D5002]